MFNLYSTMKNRNGDDNGRDNIRATVTTGHDRFCQTRLSRPSNRKKRKKNVRRAQSVTEFDPQTLSAANKRNVFKNRSASSEHDNSETEQSEKSPLVTAKLETFAKLLFRNSVPSSTAAQHQPPQLQPQYFEASRSSSSSTFISKDNQSKTSRYKIQCEIADY